MRKPHISFSVLLSQHPSRAGMLCVRPQPSQAFPVVSPRALACLRSRVLIPVQPSRHLRSTCHAVARPSFGPPGVCRKHRLAWEDRHELFSSTIQAEVSIPNFSAPVPLISKEFLIAQLLPLKQSLIPVTAVRAASSTPPCT